MTSNPPRPSIEFTPDAWRDIANIRRYTLDTFGEKQVDIYLNKLSAGFERIAHSPGIGHRHEEIPDEFLIYRVKHHYVIYQHAGDRITIMRILFTRSNLGNYFPEE